MDGITLFNALHFKYRNRHADRLHTILARSSCSASPLLLSGHSSDESMDVEPAYCFWMRSLRVLIGRRNRL